MGTKEKLIQRFLSLPTDFTWDEMHRLLVSLGYSPDNKGKTSGSQVIFKGPGKSPIMLHKSHPENINKGDVLNWYTSILKTKKCYEYA